MYEFQFSLVYSYIPALLRGFAVTMELSVLSTVICFMIVAIMLGTRYLAPRPAKTAVEYLIRVYIDVMQTLPVLVGAGMGLLWPAVARYPHIPYAHSYSRIGGCRFLRLLWISIMGAERAVTREQVHVAAIHGLGPWQIVRWIYIPVITRLTADPIAGQFIAVMKLSTFASVIGTQEILSVASGTITSTYRPLEIYTLVALIFLVTIAPANLLRRVLSGKEFRGEMA